MTESIPATLGTSATARLAYRDRDRVKETVRRTAPKSQKRCGCHTAGATIGLNNSAVSARWGKRFDVGKVAGETSPDPLFQYYRPLFRYYRYYHPEPTHPTFSAARWPAERAVRPPFAGGTSSCRPRFTPSPARRRGDASCSTSWRSTDPHGDACHEPGSGELAQALKLGPQRILFLVVEDQGGRQDCAAVRAPLAFLAAVACPAGATRCRRAHSRPSRPASKSRPPTSANRDASATPCGCARCAHARGGRARDADDLFRGRSFCAFWLFGPNPACAVPAGAGLK